MDKPIAMSVKDYLMRTQSISTNTPLKLIEAVISNQFEEANKGLKDNYSLEISGFGKFLFNHKKAVKKYTYALKDLKKCQEEVMLPDLPEKKKAALEHRIRMINIFIEQVKPKINDYITSSTDLGGVQEQVITSSGVEGGNPESLQREETNM